VMHISGVVVCLQFKYQQVFKKAVLQQTETTTEHSERHLTYFSGFLALQKHVAANRLKQYTIFYCNSQWHSTGQALISTIPKNRARPIGPIKSDFDIHKRDSSVSE